MNFTSSTSYIYLWWDKTEFATKKVRFSQLLLTMRSIAKYRTCRAPEWNFVQQDQVCSCCFCCCCNMRCVLPFLDLICLFFFLLFDNNSSKTTKWNSAQYAQNTTINIYRIAASAEWCTKISLALQWKTSTLSNCAVYGMP